MQWPESEITWVVDNRFRGIVECCPDIDRVEIRPKNPFSIRQNGKFDLGLDLQGLFKSGVIVGCSRSLRKLGYHWQREGSWLFSQRVLPDPSSVHVTDQYVDVARAAGVECVDTKFHLVPQPKDMENVSEKLRSRGVVGPFVLCNAGAGWVTKRWSPTKFAELCQRLGRANCTSVFLGAESDRPAYEEVVKAGALETVDMIGATSVRELVALVSQCICHVGGDTGSTHIAAALGRPAIGIYTLTRLERSCPYGQITNCFQGDPSVDDVLEKVIQYV